MLIIIHVLLCITLYGTYFVQGEEMLETFCNINGKHPLHQVSDKFLSVSLDPSVFFLGLNWSEKSFLLAKHLSPAYVRIAGPSTKFVKYVDNQEMTDLTENGNNIAVTPLMWMGINEWIKLTNLTPVFGINDAGTSEGAWDPKPFLPLFAISDKLDVSCYWMLGFDSSNKNETQYVNDLRILHDTLAGFPGRNGSWKVVGSDISHRSRNEIRNILDDIKDTVAAVTWESTESLLPGNEPISKIIDSKKTPVKIWMVSPKPSRAVSFSSALDWADEVGTAAKLGYDVVFRQPRIQEFLTDTPIYWFSLLHKKLMGSNVFEVRASVDHTGSSVYAHCTGKYGDFQGRGSLTVMVVNKNLQSYKVKVKLGQVPSNKYMEVQSYVLTSLHETSSDVFLNGKLLTPELLSQDDPLRPDLSLTRSKTLSLKVPPLSIGFFVLPGANVPVCLSEESDVNTESQEMAGQENLGLPEEVILTFQSRSSSNKSPAFEELKEEVRRETDPTETFSEINPRIHVSALKEHSKDNRVRQGKCNSEEEQMHASKQKELKSSILEKRNPNDSEIKWNIESRFLDLNIKETERLLKERARARAAQNNISLTDDELDIIVDAVRRTILKYKSKDEANEESLEKPVVVNVIDQPAVGENIFGINRRRRRDVNLDLLNLKSKLEDQRQRLEDKAADIVGNAQTLRQNIEDRIRKLKEKRYRFKRDINMEMLRLKTEGRDTELRRQADKTRPRVFFKNKEEREETIRRSEQMSDELLAEFEDSEEESVEKFIPNRKISGFGISRESKDDSLFKSNKFRKPSLLDKIMKLNAGKFTSNVPKLNFMKNKNDPKDDDQPIGILSLSDEFDNIEEDLPCIHEYFGSPAKNSDQTDRVGQLKKKLKKLNTGKEKLTGSSEEKPDSMEYLRRRRNYISNVEDKTSEVGELGHGGSQPSLKATVNGDNNDDSKGVTEEVKNMAGKGISYKKQNNNGATNNEKIIVMMSNEEGNGGEQFYEDGSKEMPKLVINLGGPIKKNFWNKNANILEMKQLHSKRESDLDQVKPAGDDKSVHEDVQNLHHTVENDKIKFEENADNDIRTQKIEETQKDTDDQRRKLLYEKLKSLRERLAQQKKSIDDMLKKEAKQKKNQDEEENITVKYAILQKPQELFQKLKTLIVENISNEVDGANNEDKHNTTVKIPKRSLFDKVENVFGNYKSLASDIKEWKPSDILTLKKPAKEYKILDHVITPDQGGIRRRRQAFGSQDKTTHINVIEKDSGYTKSQIRKENDYKIGILERVLKNDQPKSSKIDSEFQEKTRAIKDILDNLESDKDIKKAIAISESFPRLTNKMSENIQKIPTKKEQSLVDNFINKISGFFMNLGEVLGFKLRQKVDN